MQPRRKTDEDEERKYRRRKGCPSVSVLVFLPDSKLPLFSLFVMVSVRWSFENEVERQSEVE
jgi:hypothetical protein